MKNIALIPALAILAVSRFTSAAADPSIEVRSEVVSFGDLDIAHSPGAATLYQRLDLASRDVCRDLYPDQNHKLRLVQPYRECVRSAIRNAIATVNVPAVTALAAAHGIVVNAAPVQLARR